MADKLLVMKNIIKNFPGVKALDKVNFSVNYNEIMALVGENGAGKSTLMKVLAGVHKMDRGEIYVQSKKVEIASPLESRHLGISFIYQELNLVPNMNVAENIFMGREKQVNKVFLDRKKTHQKARDLLDMVGLGVNTQTLVGELSIGQRQMVEVARALSINSKLIVMDEPTSSLTNTEIDILLSIIRRLKKNGVSVIYISHKLDEIFEIADKVTVLRDGKKVGSMEIEEVDQDEVIQMMVGREVKDIFVKQEVEIGESVLRVEHLSTLNYLNDISFSVKKGEILGFTGLVGAGRSEVMRAVFGIDSRKSGDIYINNEKVNINSPYQAIEAGIGFVPEDRQLQGLILQMAVRKNITLARLKEISHNGFLEKEKEIQIARKYIEKLEIRTPDQNQKVINLSGGNQQKVVIAKWLAIKPRVLILDEPTRGIDVKAKKEIHLLMSRLAEQGVAIVMISSELPEILGMSDKIVVMHEGNKKGELLKSEASQEKIMKMALREESLAN